MLDVTDKKVNSEAIPASNGYGFRVNKTQANLVAGVE